MEATNVMDFSSPSTERMRRHGTDALADRELLALVLSMTRTKQRPEELATKLLAEFGGLRGLFHAGPGELAPFIGRKSADAVCAALELARRELSKPLPCNAPLSSSRDVLAAYGPRFADRTDEHVVAVILDTRHHPIAERVLSVGGPASCAIDLRAIFALAVREGGSGVLLMHNHPSGDPAPSREDIALTRAVADAGRVLEMPLLDHVIIARDGAFSFLDAGLLPSVQPRT